MQGIYAIICLPENRYYIGSSINVKRRWAEHKRELNKEIHRNTALQTDWDCYGDESFNFILLENTDKLVEREQYYINKYNKNYNIVKDSWNAMREQKNIDKMLKTKWAKGNNLTFRQKLKESDVIKIINRINDEESDISIAESYGVLRGTIWSIKTGNTWKHLHYLVKPQKSYNQRRRDLINKGLELYDEGYSIKEISKITKRKTNTVRQWIKNR